jgi:hypothetical protein
MDGHPDLQRMRVSDRELHNDVRQLKLIILSNICLTGHSAIFYDFN